MTRSWLPGRIASPSWNSCRALAHAQRAGEILSGLGGHPTMRVSAIEETGKHSSLDVLEG